MKIIGLTGSIAMGKSTTSKMFLSYGIPVHDSDHVVHDFYRKDAVDLISFKFPDAIRNGKVDRARLSEIITRNPDQLKILERLVHPYVEKRRNEFIKYYRAQGSNLVLLDIPLLFEIGGQQLVDIIVVVSADDQIQKTRALSRPNMSLEKFDLIKNKQVSDDQKRKNAHIIIDTSNSIADTDRQVVTLLRAIQ